MWIFVIICVSEHKTEWLAVCGQKRLYLPSGEREREGKSGARKVDLPVAQLLATHTLYYLLRLESPVSQGRIVEEAKYVTGDRQVSDRARGEDVWWFPLTFYFYSLIKLTLFCCKIGFGFCIIGYQECHVLCVLLSDIYDYFALRKKVNLVPWIS